MTYSVVTNSDNSITLQVQRGENDILPYVTSDGFCVIEATGAAQSWGELGYGTLRLFLTESEFTVTSPRYEFEADRAVLIERVTNALEGVE